ncbi:hypothetical protein [Vibrio atlanticus]|uniref:hypothetical protein n=1 Tax=Vibrio atlanticus TaxID=693153 RepID=UPI003553F66C
MAGIESDGGWFADLQELFGEYWDESEVLTKDAIKQYLTTYERLSNINKKLVCLSPYQRYCWSQ